MDTSLQFEPHRRALTGHCYRMLGSAIDAEDAVQETWVRAWRAAAGFDGRSSWRTWLYRIATHVCLDALSDRSRRERPLEGPLGTVDDVLESKPHSFWLEPIADARAIPEDTDPQERIILRQSTRLAFVAALQHLPPKQRAALLLTEVLGWSAAEVAESVDMSLAAINSALQRARATLKERDLTESAELSQAQLQLVDQYMRAFEGYDVDALTRLLRDDAVLSMPPYTLWLQGHVAIRTWMLGRGSGCRGSRLVPTAACASPAFGQYRRRVDGPGYRPWSLIVLELRAEQIAGVTSFLDTESLFPRFGLPSELPSET